MRILLIHQFFMDDKGVAGSRFNEMTRFWIEKGAKVTVIAGQLAKMGYSVSSQQKKAWIYREPNQEGLEVWRCHVSEGYQTNFFKRLLSYFSFVFSALYAGVFKVKGKFDVVVVTSPPLFVGITATVLSWVKRVPMVFEVRDLWVESAIDLGVLKSKLFIKLSFFLEIFFYRQAKAINVLTPAFRDNLIKCKKVPHHKIFMVPNAADFGFSESLQGHINIHEFRKNAGWDDKVVFLYVGAHGIANHLIQIIEAAEQSQNTNTLYVLIGDGMQKEMLNAEIKKRSLKNIQSLPAMPKTEVFKYILSCDVGMSVLKKADTFKTVYSNKTFDYMSCKKPILMAIDGVSRKLVEDAKCGVYVEPENTNAFLEAIEFYRSNPTSRMQHGVNGYEYAKANFDRKVLAERYFDQLTTIVN